MAPAGDAQAADAALAAALIAVDPRGVGGAVLRSGHGPHRDAWVAGLRALLPEDAPFVRVPGSASDDRLFGGLDVAATLAAGRPVAQAGLLRAAAGGVLALAMAERLAGGRAARLGAALEQDRGAPAPVALLAFDEGVGPDEAAPEALRERLGVVLALDEAGGADMGWSRNDVADAKARLCGVQMETAAAETLCAAADALGVASLRATLLAVAAARACAALRGSVAVEEPDLAAAIRLVLAPRATRWPATPDDPGEPEAAPDPAETAETPETAEASAADPGAGAPDDDARDDDAPGPQAQAERLVAAAKARLPDRLLAELGGAMLRRDAQAGRAGAPVTMRGRGRPAGSRPGAPQGGDRLDLIATVRAALGWQRLRREALPAGRAASAPRVLIRRDDLRVVRTEAKSASLIVFAVDASGSQALHRLGEAKGAIELLLGDCYARRDEVALVAFRGREAEIVLPATRSLARARRGLAGLPGGGGTPLAAGIDAAAAVADAARRKGRSPIVVMLTDGRANVARDGTGGRPQAAADALDAALRLRAARLSALLIDTSPQPQREARALAAAMAARYLPLPHADAATLSRAVRAAAPPN
ncbi:magnesium chelatase subunit D [Alsobacter sp. KACC 23698]|uniref:Magnesium chelatase subunit D n=1 Tax=Alsobacter sp. KACC 23698 TaxID=3149229 RepID=A0AAU7JDR3_9HYPH